MFIITLINNQHLIIPNKNVDYQHIVNNPL